MIQNLFKSAGIPAAFGSALLVLSTSSQAASYWVTGSLGTMDADALATVQAMTSDFLPTFVKVTLAIGALFLTKKLLKSLFK